MTETKKAETKVYEAVASTPVQRESIEVNLGKVTLARTQKGVNKNGDALYFNNGLIAANGRLTIWLTIPKK